MSSLPPEIGELEQLEELNLRDNLLRDLPKEVENLKKLKVLNLSINNFSEIPSVVFQLSSLENLELVKIGLKILVTRYRSVKKP